MIFYNAKAGEMVPRFQDTSLSVLRHVSNLADALLLRDELVNFKLKAYFFQLLLFPDFQ